MNLRFISVGIATWTLCLLPGHLLAAELSFREVMAGTAHDALFSVALDGRSLLAVGAAGRIVESQDGGETWQHTPPPAGASALLGAAIQGSRAIVVGQYGRIFVRSDATGWRSVESGSDSRLFAVAIGSGGRAAAVGAFGTILLSNDGGETWSHRTLDWSQFFSDGLEPHLYDVMVGEDGAITVVGELGLILNSADGGGSWLPAVGARRGEDSAPVSWFSVHMRVDGVGYAVGQQGFALRTTDHGRTWESVDTHSQANLFGVASLPGGQVIITGMHEVILSEEEGRSWRPVGGVDAGRGWYQGVVPAVVGDTVIMVGQGGRIGRLQLGQPE